MSRQPPNGTYWKKRAVKAEETLITIQSIADVNGYARIEEMVAAYFKSVAASEVKDVPLSSAAQQKESK